MLCCVVFYTNCIDAVAVVLVEVDLDYQINVSSDFGFPINKNEKPFCMYIVPYFSYKNSNMLSHADPT